MPVWRSEASAVNPGRFISSLLVAAKYQVKMMHVANRGRLLVNDKHLRKTNPYEFSATRLSEEVAAVSLTNATEQMMVCASSESSENWRAAQNESANTATTLPRENSSRRADKPFPERVKVAAFLYKSKGVEIVELGR